MSKNIIGGAIVGIANIIPGVSGGTMIVILGLFDKLMESISNIFKLKISFKERLNSFWFVLQILIGAAIGLVGFAKILSYTFENFELQTTALFAGLILLSIPSLKKQELPKAKLNILFFILGLLLIGLIYYLSPKSTINIVSLEELLSKNLTVSYFILLTVLGIISGATMVFPGVSGSMVLLVLGYYHLFKGYVANVTTFDLKILIPLVFIAIGVGIGIIISAKITDYLLKNYRTKTMSFIFGLIVMSVVVIIPLKLNLYTPVGIVTAIVMFIIGGLLMSLIEKLKNTN